VTIISLLFIFKYTGINVICN